MKDLYSREIYTEWDAVEELLKRPDLDISQSVFANSNTYNHAVQINYSPFDKVQVLLENPTTYHTTKQNTWFMPNEYLNLDIAAYVVSLCHSEQELERVAEELILFQDQNLFNLLRYLKYLVDVMRQHSIVHGVGRGSSVASYVLYLLGVHKINSLYFNLDIKEFLR
jgi:DNA polymerase III alpha subunit